MQRLTLWTAVCCLMSACASGPPPMPARPLAVPPPANTTVAPQPLPPPRSGRVPDLEANHLEVARRYHQLTSRHCRLLQHLQLMPAGCRRFLLTDDDSDTHTERPVP